MKEMILAGRVSDVFQIARRGLVIVPDEPWAVSLRGGEAVELRKPDGTSREARIKGVEMSNPPRLGGKEGILVSGDGLSKDDVPQGTEVYVAKTAYPTPKAS